MSWARFFRREYWDRERTEELQSYLEIEIDENIARGMSPEDATRAAHLKLGNTRRIREEIHDINTLRWLESIVRDVRLAGRGMRRRPGFTAAVIITLALGIGANTAIFSVVDSVLVRPLPYPDADRLVSLHHTMPGLQDGLGGVSPSLFFTYREQGRVFEHIGMWGAGGRTISGIGEPEQARALWVSDGVLQALGIQPRLGRVFTAEEDASSYQGPQPVIITDAFWKRRFGADPAVVGRQLVSDGRPAEIVGVMPASFRFLNLQPQPDVILPTQTNRDGLTLSPPTGMATGPTPFGQGLARLKPGVTIEDANADARRMLPLWLEMWPAQPGGFTRDAIAGWNLAPALQPLKADVVGNVGPMLWVLMATIGLVLLIACANVANLMLVRADGRRQEFSVRAALGAGRLRIAREVLVESLTLGLTGGAVGLILAYGAVRLIRVIGPTDLPRLEEISLDPRALAFTAAVSLVASIAFGVIPAVRSADRGGTPLGGNVRGASESRERHRTRNTLVVVQVALALVLLVCSGLMIRTFNALRNVNPGFSAPAQVQTMRIWMPTAAVPETERFIQAQQEVGERIGAIPGVVAAGYASALPLEGRPNGDPMFVEGQTYAAGTTPPLRRQKFISPGFFQAMGTRIVAGRDLAAADLSTTARVALISENFAREVWGSPQAALGRHIHEPTLPGRSPVWREIVGVVEDVHEDGLYLPAPTFVYWPIVMGDFYGEPLFGVRNPAIAVRSALAGTETLMQPVREAIWSVNPGLPVFLPRTMEDANNESLAHTSFALVMLGLAAAMALGLGIVGIYGVMSYVVSQRSREIGLRLALGAEPAALQRMFVRHGLALTVIGAVCGLGAAGLLTQLMSSLLFGIGPLDPATYAVVLAVLVGAALSASYMPARRAAMVNPMTTLTAE
jgi:predicted permease